MSKNFISKIINKYFFERHEAELEKEVKVWILENKNSSEHLQAIDDIWENIGEIKEPYLDRAFRKISATLGFKPQSRTFVPKFALRVAAVLLPVALIMGGIFIYKGLSGPKLITVEIGRTELSQVELPDGSTAWLNACSKLTYPENLGEQQKRSVELSGESFFVVKSDVDRPFIVNTRGLSVVATGTEFNVESNDNSPYTTVTLRSGAVAVNQPNGVTHNLKPNQQLTFDHQSQESDIQSLSQADLDEICSWKSGNLIFKRSTFNELVNKIERKYNLEFIISDSSQFSGSYSAKFPENETIENVLMVLTIIVDGFDYEIKGDKVYVK